ncbi:hypothetical protein MASSI9I_20296 [Massilia sp. 9I]|nr:hypothetical protein MASSI9I_20296 [Massilia sp. 9I]
MAADAYLQIDGIKGESADFGHQGWIELASASWGVTQPTDLRPQIWHRQHQHRRRTSL